MIRVSPKSSVAIQKTFVNVGLDNHYMFYISVSLLLTVRKTHSLPTHYHVHVFASFICRLCYFILCYIFSKKKLDILSFDQTWFKFLRVMNNNLLLITLWRNQVLDFNNCIFYSLLNQLFQIFKVVKTY